MQNAQRRQQADQGSAKRPARSVPSDWFLDPADPQAQNHDVSLEDQATAYLAAFEVLEEPASTERDTQKQQTATVTSLHPEIQPADQPQTWLGLPGFGDPADDGELAWQADALCAQTDPEAFFPEKGGSTRDAKRVCSSCTVQDECLQYALDNDERFGIWGGKSERERRRLRKMSS